MTTQQIIRLLIFAMIFVVPVVIRMIKAANEAKERRRLEQLRQYQINEAMRTGRPIEQVMAQPLPGHSGQPVLAQYAPPQAPGSPQPSPQDRLREMAARRQAQIDALRRQRAHGGQTATAPASAGPTNAYQVQANTSPYPVVRQQTGQPRSRSQPQPQRPQQQRGPTKAQRRQQAIDAQRAREAAEWSPPRNEVGVAPPGDEGEVTHRLVTDALGPEASPRPAHAAGARLPAVKLGDLRQAIILREVLGPPAAMREGREA